MCRHLAYLGAPRSLHSLVLDGPSSLMTQSWQPVHQRHGLVNVDGFGAGWYVDGRREPVRYRRAQPIWTDASFASLAPTVASRCVLAAIRSATPGFPNDESAAAPFTQDRYLFSHNGKLHDYPTARKALLSKASTARDALAAVDSALLFGLALAAWDGGASLPDGLVAAAEDALSAGGGRLTMLAADGTSIAGIVVGEPMHVLTTGDGVTVASEPTGDGDWRELADRTLVHVTADGTTLRTLDL